MDYPKNFGTDKDKYCHDKYWVDTLRTLIDRETNLTHNRITWLLATQSILFLAFSNLYKNSQPLISAIIALIGIAITITASNGLRLCEHAIRFYREEAEKRLGNDLDKYPPLDFDVTKYSHKKNIMNSFVPWKILPALFSSVWLLLLVLTIVND